MKHKLLITPIIKSHAKILGVFRIKKIVQNRQFDFGVKIKNINDQSFPGGKIKDIHIRPVSKSDDIIFTVSKEFSIQALNPDGSTEIWFDDVTSVADGAMWLKLSLVPPDGDEILSFQWAVLSKAPISDQVNQWSNSIFVTNESSIHQTTTNYLLLIFTAIILIDQMFGMKNIMGGLLNIAIFILKFLADILSSLL